MEILRRETIIISGGYIPITLSKDNSSYTIRIDGVEWCSTDSVTHATVLFVMLWEHITEYYHYVKV